MGPKGIRSRASATWRLVAGRSRPPAGDRSPLPGLERTPREHEIARSELAFDDAALERRLVWMLGSPRTGSTWLLRMLVHPWILARNAPGGLRRPPRPGRRGLPDVVPVDETYLVHHLAPLREPPGTGPDLLLNGARGADGAYVFNARHAAAWRPAVRRLILARLEAQEAEAVDRRRLREPLVVIKEPNGSHGAQLLMSLLPEARLLFVLRDGRDVVDSMLDARREGSWVGDSPGLRAGARSRRLEVVRRQSELWVERVSAVERAYAAHPEPLRLLARYEDLRREPEPELARIRGWLGLDSGDRAVRGAVEANAFEALPAPATGPGKPRRAATPGLWRENTSSGEQDVMHAVMGAKLAELGYQV